MTCLDGYQMARKGRAGVALGDRRHWFLCCGNLKCCRADVMAPPLAEFALKFGPPEYFALMVLGHDHCLSWWEITY